MKKNFEGKTIILGAPTDFNFSGIIGRELRHLGFRVIDISYSRTDFKYKNIFERLESYMHKNFLGQKNYKEILRSKHVEEKTKALLDTVHFADYALLIRPDQYRPGVVDKLKSKTLKLVGYQWDGLNRFPAVMKYIDWFDRFFVFDPDDTEVENVLPTTNFYTESFRPSYNPASQSDAYYLGNYIPERADQVEEIITTLKRLALNVKHHIRYRRNNGPKFRNLDTTNELMPYARNLHFAYNSKILVDVSNHIHNGLSFRTFEAIGFGKKLITTNKDVMRYDFYQPNNIFIWGDHDIQDLKAFIAAPYIPLPDEIREKYSFRNWISYILSEEECQPIELPSLNIIEDNIYH